MIKENILVSHNQITVRSTPFDLDMQSWTEKDIECGIIWHRDYVTLDPLVEGSFGAWFLIDIKDKIELSPDSLRAAIIPFEIRDTRNFSINTASESIYLYQDKSVNLEYMNEKGKYYPLNDSLNINFENGIYSMLFEICLGIADESVCEGEVYYRFSLIKDDNPVFKVFKDDEYGWNRETYLDEINRELRNLSI